MKLASLLAQFLYSHNRLDLAGIGSFILDSSGLSQNSSGKTFPLPGAIRFENNPSVKDSAELIGYISSQTGKMKALAGADLSSHLELAQQFLNIGKPFMLEGIGSLVKVRTGVFEFTGGDTMIEKLKDPFAKEAGTTGANEDYFRTYEPFLEKEKSKYQWRKPVMGLLFLAGIGLAVLGGYSLYKKSLKNKAASVKNLPTPPLSIPQTEPVPEPVVQTDSTPQVVASIPPDKIKYVLETANKNRAFERFNKLKNYRWNVQIETKDSMQYKLFLLLPSSSDTSWVMDSLTALNGRRVYIENQPHQ